MIKQGMLISERYEILDKVGSGGMADVYKAKCHRLNRFVAIKVLKQEYSNDTKFVSKFRAEAQSVAGLSHPNIVNVYDVGEDDGLYYIVMELVEGITLKRFIERKGKLAVKEAIGIAIQIAQGMEAAHENHIIHRDIKPQNIIISKEGKVKVTDFGIAKAATSNTITSNAMGSVHYISPEQARGGYSDEKSDIYSLGVTLYEMLSGHVPFSGDTTVTVALAHIQEEAVPLTDIDPEIPVSLERIVRKCMQKKPERRYLRASELIYDLKHALMQPNGEFVKIAAPVADDSPTIQISDDDMSDIKNKAKVVASVAAPEQADKGEASKEDEDEVDPKLEKMLLIGSAVVAVIIVLIIIFSIGKFAGWWDGSSKEEQEPTPTPAAEATETPEETPAGETIILPNLVGYSMNDAAKMLEDYEDIKLSFKYEKSDKPDGEVLAMEPEAGTEVAADSTLELTISQAELKIIDVSGMSEEAASEVLQSQGFKVETEEESSDTVEKGMVIRTSPVYDTPAEAGDTVKIIVSTGAAKTYVTMTDLTNMSEAEALEELNRLGLNKGTISYKHSNSVSKGRVMGQGESVGNQVEAGAKVSFTVSLGKEAAATPTPKPEPEYRYEGSVTISENPFEYEDDAPAEINIMLTQDGVQKVVLTETLSYNDFPKKITVEGSSDKPGIITLYKDGNLVSGISYEVTFKKVAK